MASPEESSVHEDSMKSPPGTIQEPAEPGGRVAGESFTEENVVYTSCENTHNAEDIEEVGGPSGLQAPVLVQQALCGEDDPTSLCEYERLSEEAMKEAMEEINMAKHPRHFCIFGKQGPSAKYCI